MTHIDIVFSFCEYTNNGTGAGNLTNEYSRKEKGKIKAVLSEA